MKSAAAKTSPMIAATVMCSPFVEHHSLVNNLCLAPSQRPRRTQPRLTRASEPPDGTIKAMAHLYGLDIETDTAIDGRDPRVAGVIAVAVADADGPIGVFRGDERAMLEATISLIANLPPGIVTTWNGSGFDLPFIAERCLRLRVDLPWELHETELPGKYSAIPGRAGRYRVSFGPHSHADIAWAYEDHCREHNVRWSLKPLAHSLGIDAVEADRENAGSLPTAELLTYVASDAHVTARLATRLGPTLAQFTD
jgi:DNA polymerase elongation subunit (family B)